MLNVSNDLCIPQFFLHTSPSFMRRIPSESDRSRLSTTSYLLYPEPVFVPHTPCSVIHFDTNSLGKRPRRLPLPLLPSVYPLSAKFAKPSLFIMCPRNFYCLYSESSKKVEKIQTTHLIRRSVFFQLKKVIKISNYHF